MDQLGWGDEGNGDREGGGGGVVSEIGKGNVGEDGEDGEDGGVISGIEKREREKVE